MKKILAIIVALMLLTASVAMAETATVLTVSNPVLTMNSEGQEMTFDMAGLQIELAMGMAGDTPTIQADITNGSEALLNAELQVIGTNMVVAIDGLSRPLAVDISSAGTQGVEGIGSLFAALPQLAGIKMPAFTGVNIPKLDLMSLGAYVGAAGDGQSASFEIPYEMVQQLLSVVGQYRGLVPESAQAQLEPVFDLIEDMNAKGNGFALTGSITDDGTTGTLAVDVLPVSGGVTADAAAATITFISAANQINLAVDAYQDDQTMTLGEIALTSLPDAAELNFSVDIMGGMLNLGGSLYPQDGLQVAALELVAMDQKANMSLIYGEKDGADYFDAAFEVEGQAAVEFITETISDGNGNEIGTLTVAADGAGTQIRLDSEISQSVTDVTFKTIADAAYAIDVANMSQEDNARLSEELQDVLGNLMNYVATLQPAA